MTIKDDELTMLMRHCADREYLKYILKDYLRLKEGNLFKREVCDLRRNKALAKQILEEAEELSE